MGGTRHTQPVNSNHMKSIFPTVLARVCLMAAAVDVAYLFFFWFVGSTLLTWINVASIAMYLLANRLIQRRQLRWGIFLIWTEAFPHAAIGILLLGWNSGFQYLLLMFVPAVVVTGTPRQAIAFVTALLIFLGSLLTINGFVGPLAPISATALNVLEFANFTLFVLMFSWTTYTYQRKIRRAEQKLQELAVTDSLTGLYNRRHFLELAEQSLSQAERSGQDSCIAILDVDFFKAVNDTFGHDIGDDVLKLVADQIKCNARAGDVLARWGGEEFVLLMTNSNITGAQELLERIRQSVRTAASEFKGATLSLTISGGVAAIASKAQLLEALTLADHALYESKHNGRDRITAGVHPVR
jgi:diguanylate cyclase (GGDEF)-like protein